MLFLALIACTGEDPADTSSPADDTEASSTDDTETSSDDTGGDTSPAAPNTTYADFDDPTVAMAAAILDDHLYVFGGTTAPAHIEDAEVFVDETRRLDLRSADATWEEISGSGIPTQQAQLFTHGGRLYRLGGLQATNASGEPADLWTLDDFAVYDVASDSWEALTPMPDTRGSMSLGIVDGVLHVMGGWKMEGGVDSWAYYETWLSVDLEADELVWEEHEQPFKVRDHCGGEKDGKVYLIGGMLSGMFPDEPYVYDTATGTWGSGPELPIDHVYKAFGCAAAAVDGELYFSGFDGVVYRLSDDHSAWETVTTLDPARTFHALPARSATELVAVGGGTGTDVDAVATVESISID